MFVDEKGFLWISNFYGDGLIRFDYRNDSIVQFNRNDGLQSNYIRSINGNEAGTIWLTSEFGVTSFNLQTLKKQSILNYNGFQVDDLEGVYDPLSKSMISSATKFEFTSTPMPFLFFPLFVVIRITPA